MPLKVLISSVEFQGPNAPIRQVQAKQASLLSMSGDINVYGQLVLEVTPGHEVIIPREDFYIVEPMAIAA